MRVLVLGGDLAGLLTALQLQRHGGEVCLLVHQQEAPLEPLPPMVFTDPGPWGSRQSTWATLGALLHGSGDFRLGLGALGKLPWLSRCLQHRVGAPERSQASRALALARHSTWLYDELRTTGCVLPEPKPLSQVTVYEQSQAAKAHFQRSPVWHMGGRRPILSPLGEQAALLPALDMRGGARQKPTLTSGGMMVWDSAGVVAGLRDYLIDLGVRFIYDRAVSGVEHIGEHLHGVTLRGPRGAVEEIDTDVVVATSVPAARPVLDAVGHRPDLALVTTLSLSARLAGSSTSPIYLHDQQRGIRLIRQGSEVWALGPTWLGQPRGSRASELAQLTAQMALYFGSQCIPFGDMPMLQTSWVAPDGLPVVSRTNTRNLFLNIGHHSATAGLAFGAAAMLQTLMEQVLNITNTASSWPRWSLGYGPLQAHSLGQIHE